jgi:hypothetical protein
MLATSEQSDKVFHFPHESHGRQEYCLAAPLNSGSKFCNYSACLFCLEDGNYNFLFANASCQGRIANRGLFWSCKLYVKLEGSSSGFPSSAAFAARTEVILYFFVADEATPV